MPSIELRRAHERGAVVLFVLSSSCSDSESQVTTNATMKSTHILFSLLALLASDFKDNFTDPNLKERRAGRGDWKIADGIAR